MKKLMMIRDNPFLNNVRGRLWRENRNFISITTGPTGSGKSWANLTMCMYTDKKFTINNVFFDILPLIEALREGRLGRGSAIMLDEAGISFASRNFQSVQNKQMSGLLQIFRAENIALFMTLPNMGFLDKAGRMLMHTHLETMFVDRGRRVCRMRWKYTDFNSYKGKVYEKYPRVKVDGVKGRVPYFEVAEPPEPLKSQYEKAKKAYLKEQYNSIYEKLKPIEKEKRVSKAQRIIAGLKLGKTPREIASDVDTSIQYVRQYVRKTQKL